VQVLDRGARNPSPSSLLSAESPELSGVVSVVPPSPLALSPTDGAQPLPTVHLSELDTQWARCR
jgi:hypothetical protein